MLGGGRGGREGTPGGQHSSQPQPSGHCLCHRSALYIVEADLSGDITLFNQSSFPNKIIYSDLVPVGSSTCTQILQNKLN